MKKKLTQVMVPELKSLKLQLMLLSTSKTIEDLAIANFLFLLMEIVDKVEVLAKEVETLGEVAGFQSPKGLNRLGNPNPLHPFWVPIDP